ncbi:MAG: hypothetical protein Kow00124_14150 [Anaerolineae bacterium]
MSKTRVIIIDDENETIRMLKSFLELFSYEVVGVQTGQDGLREIEAERPGVVILDLMLPDMDGLEICRAIRSAEATRDLPVIILSARSSKDEVRRGYAAGASRYLKKPVDLDQLAGVVSEVVTQVKHQPPPEALQLEDAVRPASGFMRPGTIQAGVAVPIAGKDVDFVIGAEPPTAEGGEAAVPHEKDDTLRLPGLYIRREDEEETAPDETG